MIGRFGLSIKVELGVKGDINWESWWEEEQLKARAK